MTGTKPGGAGAFLVLEGIDGSGTTTQGQQLVTALRERGVDARFTHEPSTGPVGQLLRRALSKQEGAPSDWKTLALLFAADRTDHLEREIEPALRAGAVVICDRYDLSSLSYQFASSSNGDASVLAWIRELNGCARRPDCTFVLDVRPEVAAERRRQRGQTEELFEREALQARLAELYLRAEQLVPRDRVVHLDGNESLQKVRQSLWNSVASYLKMTP